MSYKAVEFVAAESVEKIVQWKIDAFSAVWDNSTLNEVMEYIQIKDKIGDYWTDTVPVVVDAVYGVTCRFVWHNMVFEFGAYEFRLWASNKEDIPLQDFVFSKIKFSAQGKGLDYLREENISIDQIVRKPCPKMHPTRVDFAFDFFNYGNDFLDGMEKFLSKRSNLSETMKISIAGLVSTGISYLAKVGATERTYYLGSRASTRMLRIYDKYLEKQVSGKGHFQEVVYDPRPDCRGVILPVSSWIRFEWQLRKDEAIKALYSTYTGSIGVAILKQLLEYYQIISYNTRKPADFWKSFFNPRKYEGNLYETVILYNKGNEKTAVQKLDQRVEAFADSLLCYSYYHGSEAALEILMRQRLTYLQKPLEDEIDESIRVYRLFKFKKQLCEISPTGELSAFVRFDEKGNMIYPSCK